jgi:gamma-glutamyltranspeptidase/glutathione hydrolase
MPQIGYAHRQAPMGRHGMVATCHPLASLAGVETLRSGGNVIDAAVAANAVLGVTQPNYCGFGGDLFCLYYEAATRRVHFLNGAGRSGSRASLDELERRGHTAVPGVGPGSVSVPGVTRAWAMLRERYGTRSMAELLAPAMHYAADGFPISDIVCQAIRERFPLFDDPEWRRIFVPNGVFPEPGDMFRQPDLARSIAELGAGPDLFYNGRVGRAIAARLERDGFLTPDDLAAHQGEWGEPLSTTYRGYTVYETPPPTQGLATLLTLNLLEGFEVTKHAPDSVERLHLLLETTKLAYADRDRWIADPAQSRPPVERLLAKSYADRRRADFDPRKAQLHAWGDVDGDTTGFVIADGEGNVLSVIQSLFRAFGSGVVAPGTGVVLQNRGSYFNVDPEHPNCFAPGKRPFHTLMAGMVTREGRPVLGLSTMGGDGQAMFHSQILTNALDYGMEIQEAIERPRFMYGRINPSDAPDLVRLEGRMSPPLREALVRQGHNIQPVTDWFAQTGQAQAVAVLDNGVLRGAADPRGDGAAMGY